MTVREFLALTQRELLKWIRAPIGIVSSLMLPFFYLLLFGQALNLGKLVPASEAGAVYLGAPDYFSYFSVGMVGFIMLFTGLFAGANVIFARRFGTLKKETAAPIPREIIFTSRVSAGVIRGVIFGTVVFAIAIAFAHVPGLNGLTLTGTSGVLGAAEILVAMACVTALFSSIFIALGFLTEQIESYFALVNLVNLPVLFSSNALFPTSLFPAWLKGIAAWNPVSLGVDVMRENAFGSQAYYPYSPAEYLGILLALTIVFVAGMAVVTRWSLRPR
ncbi:MAG TPA: ABC transporter permease [Thermoplasmata archaeon]|nr:ABC transporter permease [Thermoplasmata archaeon]